MKCENCGHTQENGTVCDECGGELKSIETTPEPEQTETETEYVVTDDGGGQATSDNDFVQKAQDAVNDYVAYLIEYAKEPTKIFKSTKDNITNGFINIGLTIFFLSFILYNFTRKMSAVFDPGSLMELFGGESTSGVPFFSTWGKSLFYVIIIMAIVVSLLFVTNKVFGNGKLNYLETYSLYGTIILPIVFLSALVFLLSFMTMGKFIIALIAFILAALILLLPIHMISFALATHGKALDPLYSYLCYAVVSSFIFYQFVSLFMKSMFRDLMGPFSGLF